MFRFLLKQAHFVYRAHFSDQRCRSQARSVTEVLMKPVADPNTKEGVPNLFGQFCFRKMHENEEYLMAEELASLCPPLHPSEIHHWKDKFILMKFGYS